jgi:hypothetical protein
MKLNLMSHYVEIFYYLYDLINCRSLPEPTKVNKTRLQKIFIKFFYIFSSRFKILFLIQIVNLFKLLSFKNNKFFNLAQFLPNFQMRSLI